MCSLSGGVASGTIKQKGGNCMNNFITDVAGGLNPTLSFFGRIILRSAGVGVIPRASCRKERDKA